MMRLATTVASFIWIASGPEAHAACTLCSCSVSASDVVFGTFQPLDNTPKDSNGAVTVTCGPIGLLVSYDLKLTAGGAGVFAARRMASGANHLSYNLYTSATHANIWGDGTSGTSYISDTWLITLGQTSRSHTVYGRIPAAPTARPAVYADTVVARIEW